jgi:hypothetical protein
VRNGLSSRLAAIELKWLGQGDRLDAHNAAKALLPPGDLTVEVPLLANKSRRGRLRFGDNAGRQLALVLPVAG